MALRKLDDMKDRDKKLMESLVRIEGPFQPYTLGRKMILRVMGNPLFGGDGEEKDWPHERKWGIAWVIYTRDYAALKAAQIGEVVLPEELDGMWENVHVSEIKRFQEWVNQEEELERAARTEAIEETRGKSDESKEEQSPTS